MDNTDRKDYEVKSRKLLYIIITTLVFEGLIRKSVPSALSIILFFLKDYLCFVGLYYFASSNLVDSLKKAVSNFKVLIIFFYPLLCFNLFFDPVLLFWGGKLYLLYIVVALLMPIAFPPNAKEHFYRFIRFICVLIIPTVLLGLVQLTLPATHWLNTSVDGGSLADFSAAGVLRISSTFSFTGQYSYFLSFVSAIFMCFFFLKSTANNFILTSKFFKVIIGFLLFIGCYSTGGRTAVYGFLIVVSIGFLLASLKTSGEVLKKASLPFLLSFLLIPMLKEIKPEAFKVFEKRDTSEGSDEEFIGRVFNPFVDGVYLALDKDVIPMFFGEGLGVMTNGADKISTYAYDIRKSLWTETDFSTTAWEGGFYLIAVWYFFRLTIIIDSIKKWYSIKDKTISLSAGFLVAFIVVQGCIGTLSLQPPLAIYFWLSFGAIICMQQFDAFEQEELNM